MLIELYLPQYSLFANASLYGTPPVRALFFEFPDEPELFAVDQQFLVGSDILVTPVLTPNVSTVEGTCGKITIHACKILINHLNEKVYSPGKEM